MSEGEKASPAATYLASAHLQERRESRYAAKIEIEVSGINASGQMFHERTVTTNVSEWGCGFLLPIELKAGDIIVIRVNSADAPAAAHQAMFQVMRVQQEAGIWTVGAWKLEGSDLWGGELERLGKLEESKLGARKDDTEEGKNSGRDPGR
ncbi:MAG: PilZ domain-containing protein [Candidatus Acidiferrales bacterium]